MADAHQRARRSLTIGSLQLLFAVEDTLPAAYLHIALVPGPLLGVLAFRRVGR